MARPARVRMRSRKPWVFARRRVFGWKVRLLTRYSKNVGVGTPSVLDDAVKVGRSKQRLALPTRGPAPLVVVDVEGRDPNPYVGAQKYQERLYDVTPPMPSGSNQNGEIMRVGRATSGVSTGRAEGSVTCPCTTCPATILAIHNLWTTVWAVLHHGRLQDTPSTRRTPAHETKESQWPTRTRTSVTSGHRP
jgi:hypothetical protein